MESLLTIIPAHDAQIALAILPIAGAILSLIRKFFVKDGSTAAKYMDPVIALLPIDLHKTTGG